MVNNRKRRSLTRARRGRRNRSQRGSSSINNLPQVASSTRGQSLVSRSVRTLIGALPIIATPLGAISNFVFKSIGLASEVIVQNGHISANVANTQLTGKFILTIGSLLMGASFCNRSSQNSVYSRYTRFQLHSFKISVASVSPPGHRAGELFLGLVPFYSDAEATAFNDKDVPPETELFGMQYVRKGPVNRPLSITYRTQNRHGQLCQDMGSDTKAIGVMIQFSDYYRDAYEDFKASEFAVDVLVEARLGARSPVIGGGDAQYSVHKTGVIDCLNTVTNIIRTSDSTIYVGPPETVEVRGVVPIGGREHVYGKIIGNNRPIGGMMEL